MKISEAFDTYGKYMTVKGQSGRTVDHNNYVKRTFVEAIGDIKLSKLTLDDVYNWERMMRFGELPNGKKIKRSQNSLRCDLLRLRVMLKHMDLMGEKCIDYKLIPIPKRVDIQRTFLYEDEVTAMIDSAFSIRNKFIISLLLRSL